MRPPIPSLLRRILFGAIVGTATVALVVPATPTEAHAKKKKKNDKKNDNAGNAR